MFRIYLSLISSLLIFLFACSGTTVNNSDAGYDVSVSDDALYADNSVVVSDINSDEIYTDSGYTDTAGLPDGGAELTDSSFDMEDILNIQDISDVLSDTDGSEELTPEQIGFENAELPQKGSVIFYNNWATGNKKDSVEMISPDGTYRAVRMYANRVWSFGVSQTGNLLVFSTNDPYQEEHYGLTINDAIQNTWLLGDSLLPVQISFGPVNDECHNFISDELLMMCRRANFRPDPEYYVLSDPYRILTHNLLSHEEIYLTPLDQKYNDYYGAVRDDGIILFNRNIVADRTIDIMSLDISDGKISLLLEDANGPVLSPDGKEILFKKKGQNKIFLSSSYDLNGAVPVIDGGNRIIGRYVFSPDGSMIAYTLEDRANNCSDLMISERDGSNINKILDCSDEKKFITVIHWVNVR